MKIDAHTTLLTLYWTTLSWVIYMLLLYIIFHLKLTTWIQTGLLNESESVLYKLLYENKYWITFTPRYRLLTNISHRTGVFVFSINALSTCAHLKIWYSKWYGHLTLPSGPLFIRKIWAINRCDFILCKSRRNLKK